MGDGVPAEGHEDSQAPSLSSSSSTWSLRDSILSPRSHSSATCSGCSSSGGTGSTARTQAPACPAHYKRRGTSGCHRWGKPCPAGWPQAPQLTCSSRSRRPCSSRISRLKARSPCSASRTGAKESMTTARALPPAWPSPRPTHPPLTRHAKDAGTSRGFRGPFCAGAPVQTQHQAVGTATGEAACRVEATVRTEGDASPTFIRV